MPTSSPGFSWQPLHTMPGISTFYTFYDDVRVPVSALVGEENQGWQLITTQLNFERAALGTLGALEPLFEKTLDWAPLPNSTVAASSTSPGCSSRWPGSRHKSRHTNSSTSG